jgi:predicted nucleic acid-binding protein
MNAPAILIDTSGLISFLRGDPPGAQVRLLLTEQRGVISAISVYELFAGVRSEKHRGQRSRLVGLTRVLPVDDRIARRGAALFTSLRRQGITVDNEDLIIAATALEQDLALLSGNIRHFEAIPELRLMVPDR